MRWKGICHRQPSETSKGRKWKNTKGIRHTLTGREYSSQIRDPQRMDQINIKTQKIGPDVELDIKRLNDMGIVKKAPQNHNYKDVTEKGNKIEKEKKENLPKMQRLPPPPILGTRDMETRKNAISWYGGGMIRHKDRRCDVRSRKIQEIKTKCFTVIF